MHATVLTSGQFGPVLKALRKQKGWSQSALGAHIGLSQERISQIERHPEKVTFDQLLTVLMALDATLAVSSKAGPAEKRPSDAPAASDPPAKGDGPW
ncbi:MAG: helix-turn-helix domain-containing protein [Burkholderiaceae bacterium]